MMTRRIERWLLRALLWMFALTEERHVCRRELCAEQREK